MDDEFKIINENIEFPRRERSWDPSKYSMNPHAVYMRKYKENPENRDKLNANRRKLTKTPEFKAYAKQYRRKNPTKFLFCQARKRAKDKGLEFTIKESHLIVPEFCPVLGIKIIFGDKKQHDNSPSVDRIDSSKGYIPGNVAVISWRANNIKRDGTAEEHIAIAKYISGARG